MTESTFQDITDALARGLSGKGVFAFGSYLSPVGRLAMCSDSKGLAALWFAGHDVPYAQYIPGGGTAARSHNETAARWLDAYFCGHALQALPQLSLKGTAFEKKVWEMLTAIPLGHTTTYGALAKALALAEGKPHISARAIGRAVSRNPVCIIIPCHRVIGSHNSLTGFRYGIDKKAALLAFEGIDVTKMH